MCPSHGRKRVFALLAYVRKISVVSPPLLDSIRVVGEFMDVFTTYFLGMPPYCDIDFAINIEPVTKPISIPS